MQHAALFLDKKMTDVAEYSQLASSEDIAIITALNVIQEFTQKNHQLEEHAQRLNKRLQTLQNKIENLVTKQNEMEL